jgi:hypothetical protein
MESEKEIFKKKSHKTPVNPENMQAIFHFGHKILFDGYLMGNRLSIFKDMNIKYFFI